MCLFNYGWHRTRAPFVQIGLLFLSVQPIFLTIMAMTKTDVRKYTIELLTLPFIKRKN